MTLLRPEAWLPFNGIEIGSELPVYLGEDVGVLPVTVVAIGRAPADIEPGSPTRGLVISTCQRTDRAVLDLFLDTNPIPLTITTEHPVWSVDREGWVYAGDLRPGECVETLDGVAYVLASLPAGERTVYDIEVLGDHTFYAGEQGVWVHNCGPIEPSRVSHVMRHMADFPHRSVPHGVWVAQSRSAVERVVREAMDAGGVTSGFRGVVDLGVTVGRQLGNPSLPGYGRAASGVYMEINRAGRAVVAYPRVIP